MEKKVTGGLFGANYASWKYAEIVNQGYVEIIKGEGGGLFVRHAGKLYRLEDVNDHVSITGKLEEIHEMLKEHEEEDRKEFENLHNKIEK
jgi:hypothetical protein